MFDGYLRECGIWWVSDKVCLSMESETGVLWMSDTLWCQMYIWYSVVSDTVWWLMLICYSMGVWYSVVSDRYMIYFDFGQMSNSVVSDTVWCLIHFWYSVMSDMNVFFICHLFTASWRLHRGGAAWCLICQCLHQLVYSMLNRTMRRMYLRQTARCRWSDAWSGVAWGYSSVTWEKVSTKRIQDTCPYYIFSMILSTHWWRPGDWCV